jgi:hypothetical protein
MQMKPSLQRVAEGGSHEAGGNLESRLSSSKGGGSPLPDDVRSFMEPRFGADFSRCAGAYRLHCRADEQGVGSAGVRSW